MWQWVSPGPSLPREAHLLVFFFFFWGGNIIKVFNFNFYKIVFLFICYWDIILL